MDPVDTSRGNEEGVWRFPVSQKRMVRFLLSVLAMAALGPACSGGAKSPTNTTPTPTGTALQLQSQVLPRAWFNIGYSSGQIAATGGTLPYQYIIASSSLPAGLSAIMVGNAMTLVGRPTASAATYTFDVRVDDSAGAFAVATYTLPLSDAYDLNGTWRFEIDVTSASGACAGNQNLPNEVVDITFTATSEGSLIASGFLGMPANRLLGELTTVSNTPGLSLDGCYPEDGGTTDTRHGLAFTGTQTTSMLSGNEFWDWHDANVTCPMPITGGRTPDCPNGQSIITATKR